MYIDIYQLNKNSKTSIKKVTLSGSKITKEIIKPISEDDLF